MSGKILQLVLKNSKKLLKNTLNFIMNIRQNNCLKIFMNLLVIFGQILLKKLQGLHRLLRKLKKQY